MKFKFSALLLTITCVACTNSNSGGGGGGGRSNPPAPSAQQTEAPPEDSLAPPSPDAPPADTRPADTGPADTAPADTSSAPQTVPEGSPEQVLNFLLQNYGANPEQLKIALKNLDKPTGLGFKNDTLYPADQLINKVVELKYPAVALSRIRLGSHLAKAQIQASPNNQVIVTITASADPENAQRAQVLANSLVVQHANNELSIRANLPNNACFMYTVNQAMSLKGSCYTSLVLALPATSPIAVFQDGELIQGPKGSMTFDILMDALAHASFDSKRLEVVDQFVQNASPNVQLSAAQLTRALRSLSFDNDRYHAFDKLVPFLKKSDRAEFSRGLNNLFMMSNRDRAYQRLLSLT